MWSRPRGNSLTQWVSVQRPLVPRERARGQSLGVENVCLKTLNRDLILESQCASEGSDAPFELEAVERIALRSHQIGTLDEEAILSCVRLRICNLNGCYIQDIAAFYGSVNLLKLDLSDNEITCLPPADFWVSLVSLQVLYLDGNLIGEKDTLNQLSGCPRLHILTLYNTPVSLARAYRHHVVNSLFSLKALDQYVISDQEIIEDFYVTEKFRALSHHFRLPLHISIKPQCSLREELSQVYGLLLAVERVLARHSPVLIIQRYARSWLLRRTLMKTATHKIKNFLVKRKRLTSLLPQKTSTVQHSSYTMHRPLLIVTPPPPEGHPQLPFQGEVGGRAALPLDKAASQPQAPEGGAGRVHEALPPAPPSSSTHTPVPPRMVVSHVLGVEEGNRLRFSMHINLGRLQQRVAQSEKDAESLVVGQSGLRKAKEGGGKRRRGEGPSGHRHLRGKRTPDSKMRDVRTLSTEEDEEEGAGKGGVSEEGATTGEGGVAPTEQGMEVAGTTVTILPGEELPDLLTSKRENVEMFRQAEKEISKRILRLRNPAPKKSSEPHPKGEGMSKDDFMFTRVFGTMSLDVIRKINKVHQARKLREEHKERTKEVAMVRRERVTRRAQILAFQNQLRERVQLWRCQDESLLDQRKEGEEKARQAKARALRERQQAERLSARRQREEREFSSSFKQNSTMIANTLSAEDRRAALSTSSASARERVQQVKEESCEQQEEVRRYLEHRRNKVLQEAREGKKELDTKTLELASQRMMQAKQKIAREVARKAAARVAIALAKEEMRVVPQGPGEGVPSASQGPMVWTDLDPVSPPKVVSSEAKSPKRACRNHYTWQRGSEAVERDKQFPVLMTHQDPSPHMYHKMVPHLPRKSAETPFTSSTRSMLTTPPVTPKVGVAPLRT